MSWQMKGKFLFAYESVTKNCKSCVIADTTIECKTAVLFHCSNSVSYNSVYNMYKSMIQYAVKLTRLLWTILLWLYYY